MVGLIPAILHYLSLLEIMQDFEFPQSTSLVINRLEFRVSDSGIFRVCGLYGSGVFKWGFGIPRSGIEGSRLRGCAPVNHF